MRLIVVVTLLALAGCASNYVARTDHFKIVKGLHTKADVRLLIGEPVYDGPFRPTFPARELPAGCPRNSTSYHYLSRYESTTGGWGDPFKFRQADVIHFDEKGVVCAVSSKACYNHHNAGRCYEDAEKGIEKPYRF